MIVNLVFSHFGFGRGILFLIAPFSDRFLLGLTFDIGKIRKDGAGIGTI